jgi:hypothetical protein
MGARPRGEPDEVACLEQLYLLTPAEASERKR